MDYKYYKDIPTTSYVSFKLLSANRRLIIDYANNPCFANIAHGFDEKTRFIQVYHEKRKVPYSVNEVKRWIDDLNEVGFPCSFENDLDKLIAQQVAYLNSTVNNDLENMALMVLRHGKEVPETHYNFFVKTNDFTNKNHLFSTLFLIRCLFESGINRVPEEYFKLMDNEPTLDKFDACQTAHKIVSNTTKKYDPLIYANTGHMITFDGNGKNITKAALMERFTTRKTDLHDKGFLRINFNWNGTDDVSWKTV